MKLYKDAPNAGIEMHHDPMLIAALEKALVQYRVDVALETGTFHGKGSTRLVAECMKRVAIPKIFTSVEISFENWVQAKYNLRDCLFVNCLWGSSLDIEAAIAFMQTDDMLLNHQNYDDIYIDDIEDPVATYTEQVRGLTPYSDFDPGSLTEARQWMWRRGGPPRPVARPLPRYAAVDPAGFNRRHWLSGISDDAAEDGRTRVSVVARRYHPHQASSQPCPCARRHRL